MIVKPFTKNLQLSITVLFAVILAQNFLSTEISSLIIFFLGLSIAVLASQNITRSYLKLIRPLIVILTLGLIGLYEHDLSDILRDIAYSLTPISLLLIGFWMAGNKVALPLILKIIVSFGFVLAAIHLFTFVLNPALLNASLVEVRETAGPGYGNVLVLSLVLALLQNHLSMGNLFPRLLPKLLALPFLFASFVLSFSRTQFIMALVLFLAIWLGGKRVNLRLILFAFILILGFAGLVLTTPDDEMGTFRSKLLHSATEVAVSNYEDQADINSNWRGFESYRAWSTFTEGNLAQQVFGQGFGALADLGFYMTLGGADLRYIPIFHNGYAYIILKTGFVGLLCYFFFYISTLKLALRQSDSAIGELRISARLLLGITLSLLLSMFVVGGMAEMHDSEFVLLLGYLVRHGILFQGVNNGYKATRVD
ncbi:O-antigen ligase-related [Methylophilaceae bacterium]